MVDSAMLETSREAARAAEAVIREYYHGDFSVRHKADDSPVTPADVECEQAIKRVIGNHYPDHGFYGEELGSDSLDAEYLWLIDPIDGTKSFVRGYPFFSTQIALMHQGELVLGVSNAPLFGAGEMAWAASGHGAYLNGDPIHVSDVTSLNRATLSVGNIETLAAGPRWVGLGRLIPQVHRFRGYGDFYHYHLLAGGRIEAVLESDVDILDIAAVTVIVREAGGEVSDLEGRTIDLDTRSIFATNGHVTAAVRDELNA